MREVAIVGCGMTKFGRHDDKSLMDLLVESSLNAIEDANVTERDFDSVYVANMLAGEVTNQTCIATALTDELALVPAAADRVENGTASGGSALKNAFLAVASGGSDLVLVTGGEKMTHVPLNRMTDLIATMSHPTAEYIHGITFPALAALFARMYMLNYKVRPEHLAMVAVKNHLNALKNPYAQLHKRISLEEILHASDALEKNPIVAEPLRLYDCCPVTDGAASVILYPAENARKFCDTPVRIAGVAQATDTHALQDRDDPLLLRAVKTSAEKAFEMANLRPSDIDVVELHDAFTVLELAESEDSGFFRKGEGHKALEQGITSIGGSLPINPSGGLKARGHPVGATGLAQVVELVWQLRGEAEGRQIAGAEKGFSCNMGGFASSAVCHALVRMT